MAALLIAAPAGIILGVASAKRWRGSGVSRGFMVTLSSFPIFLTALFGILLFYYKLHWLPATGQTSVANPPAGPTGFLLIDSLLAGEFGLFWTRPDMLHCRHYALRRCQPSPSAASSQAASRTPSSLTMCGPLGLRGCQNDV